MPIHQGTKTIETQRLILRRAAVEDAQAMFDNWASDPEVVQYLTWPVHTSPETTRQVLQSWVSGYGQDNFYQWLIVPKEVGQPVGSISGKNLNDQLSSVEVAYCVGQPWWHQGLTTEALQGVLGYLFDACDFHRITAKHDTNNPHSGGVMKKCGMTREGTSKQSARNNQGICDTVHYAILKSQWNVPKSFADRLQFENDTQLVQELYRRLDENSRLNHSKAARVEFLTTVEYIQRYLTPGANILDLGAGAGEYSLYFARQGYQVSALELSEENIAAFRKKLTPRTPLIWCRATLWISATMQTTPLTSFSCLGHCITCTAKPTNSAVFRRPSGCANRMAPCSSPSSPTIWSFSPCFMRCRTIL